MVNEKDAAENIRNSSKKAALKNGMMELMQNKSKDQKQRAAHKLRKNQIKETIEKRSKEQRVGSLSLKIYSLCLFVTRAYIYSQEQSCIKEMLSVLIYWYSLSSLNCQCLTKL